MNKTIALLIVFIWFFAGGIGHFLLPDFFLKIIPPNLPFRIQAVYISGFFELAGAAGLLHPTLRKISAIGLFLLTMAVTPANVYMWRNPELFPRIPATVLGLRLILQVFLLALIGWVALCKDGEKLE